MKEFLSHFFIPQRSNNYRAKLLHHNILLFFIAFFVLSSILLESIRINLPQVLGISTSIGQEQLLTFVNQKRQENGLPALSLSSELAAAAQNKAKDMFAKDYWAHNSPDGKSPWAFFKEANYNYVYAGENLARGFSTSEEVTNAWMASPDHRANILSQNYSEVGFAVEIGNLNGEETVLVVQELGSRVYAGTSPEIVTEKSVSTSAIVQKPDVSVAGETASKVNLSVIKKQPLINSFSLTSNISNLVLIIFISVLFVDMIIVGRKKLFRFIGHNTDHIFYLVSILIILAILGKGVIL
ncbi:MAG: hypothetical protein HYT08_01895 [Candidatus Levybacteria bacterium]|nr:hypothetical protein [Candidatus Levybacteria bacterium]